MKSFLKSLLTASVLGLAVLPALSLAQPPGGGGPGGPGGGRGRGMMSPEARVAAIDEAVKLTADQKTKVTAIVTKASADSQAAAEDREKRREITEASNKEIRALLTAEQQTKFDAMPAPGRGGRGPGGPGGPGGGGQGGEKK